MQTPSNHSPIPDLLDLLAALFAGPDETCPDLIAEEIPAVAADLGGSDALPQPLRASLQQLARAWTPPPESSAEAFCEELESQYVTLFVNTIGGVAAPPYASVYEPQSRGMKGKAWEAMEARLRQEGLETDSEVMLADNICVQLEYLRRKLEAGAAQEAREFAAEMLEWTRKFVAAMDKGQPAAPYHSAGALLLAVLEHMAGE